VGYALDDQIAIVTGASSGIVREHLALNALVLDWTAEITDIAMRLTKKTY